jgi:hypothetical protein
MNNSNTNSKKNSCDEILKNMQRTLHECRDNKKEFFINKIMVIDKCDNITDWSKDVFYHVGLKLNIKHPVIFKKYTIEYNVKSRTLSIS